MIWNFFYKKCEQWWYKIYNQDWGLIYSKKKLNSQILTKAGNFYYFLWLNDKSIGFSGKYQAFLWDFSHNLEKDSNITFSEVKKIHFVLGDPAA